MWYIGPLVVTWAVFLEDAAALSFNLSKRHTNSIVVDPPWSAPGAGPPFRDRRPHVCGSRNGCGSGRRITGEVLTRL